MALEHLHATDHVDVDLIEIDPGIDSIRETARTIPDGLIVARPLGRATLAELVFGSPDRRGGRIDSGIPVVLVPSHCSPPCRGLSARPALTVGFHGSIPAVAALRWAVREADRRDALVRAVLVWCEGQYGCVGGSVAIGPPVKVEAGHVARQLATDSLSRLMCRLNASLLLLGGGHPPASWLRRRRDRTYWLWVRASQWSWGIQL